MTNVNRSWYSTPDAVIVNNGEITVKSLNGNNVILQQEVILQSGSTDEGDYEEILEVHATRQYLPNATEDGVLENELKKLNDNPFYINRAGELIKLELGV